MLYEVLIVRVVQGLVAAFIVSIPVYRLLLPRVVVLMVAEPERQYGLLLSRCLVKV